MWEFDAFIEEGDEDFASYVERFGHYCKVAGVQDEELKKSAFISAIGKKAYKTLKDLLLPAKPEEKTFEDLVKVLSGHYEPSSQVIAERFKANRRYQGEAESVAAFAVTLKHIAAKCNYGTFLDDALRCKQPAPATVHNVSDEASGGTELVLHGVYLVGTEQPYEVEVQIAGQLVKMQVDTGAAVSLVPECVYRQLKQPPQLAKCEMKLKTYGGATLQVKGQTEVLVVYKGQWKVLPIIEVPGEKPALLGRDWIANLGMDLNSIHEVHAQPSVDSILPRHASNFSPGLGLIKGYQAKLVLKEGSMPVFCKARSVPYAIREPVEHELGNLQKEGVLVPVTRSDWATPLVAVHKPDGTYVRMPYGISSAPAVFQAIMNKLLKRLPGVVCYLDDVLITGASHTECLARVEAVLQVFMDHGVKVEAIREAPTPKNISELKAYLGMITFYSKFMPNMSSRLKPLYALLQKDKKNMWIPEQTRMAQPGSTPSQSDSDTASPPDGPAPEQRLPPPDRASVTELPSQQAPDASSQENVAPPQLRRSTRIRKPPERFGYAAK
ncbi:uncharacterized protein LOC142817623 [Rhipicephalus microplus]|uniref:uncharacterized protein LOC142817623 n=1 Tax=Rhipicephalus microplus TaxID=6941 RepID=UPI003F6CFE69